MGRSVAGAALVALAGCSLIDLRMPATGDTPVCPEPGLCDTDPTRALIAYHRVLHERDGAALQRLQRGFANAADTPAEQVRRAIVLSHPRAPADLPQALALLDAVLAGDTDEARALHDLAHLLANEVRARQRLGEQLERAAAQARAAETARARLQQKLDALTEIERSLPARPDPDATLPEPQERSDPQ